MKKLLLASAVAALSVTAANAAPTVYGKAFLTLDVTDSEITTTTSGMPQVSSDVNTSGLNSNGSRIGLKGSEALTADTDVIYQLEYAINVDDSSNQFTSRDTYLGLTNEELGTLLAGRLTTIDDYVDYADALEGSNIADVGPTFNELRANNAFAYLSPNYDGVTFMAMYGFDSDTDGPGLDNEDQYGVGVTFDAVQNMDLGATYIGHGDDQHIRLGAGYQFSPELYVGGYYQISEFGGGFSKQGIRTANEKLSPFNPQENPTLTNPVGTEKENSIVIGGEYTTNTPWSYYAQVAFIDNAKGWDDDEMMGVGGGAKYAFTKAATGHIYAGYSDSENATWFNPDGSVAQTVENDGFGLGAGLEYKF